MFRTALLLAGVATLLVFVNRRASADKMFGKQFEELYQDSISEERMEEARCYVCHVDGEKKSVNNVYGQALEPLLDRENFNRAARREAEEGVLEAEIIEALRAVEEMEAPAGGTFGERIANGLLPVEFVPAPGEEEE